MKVDLLVSSIRLHNAARLFVSVETQRRVTIINVNTGVNIYHSMRFICLPLTHRIINIRIHIIIVLLIKYKCINRWVHMTHSLCTYMFRFSHGLWISVGTETNNPYLWVEIILKILTQNSHIIDPFDCFWSIIQAHKKNKQT